MLQQTPRDSVAVRANLFLGSVFVKRGSGAGMAPLFNQSCAPPPTPGDGRRPLGPDEMSFHLLFRALVA
jgi:hypothetical protein